MSPREVGRIEGSRVPGPLAAACAELNLTADPEVLHAAVEAMTAARDRVYEWMSAGLELALIRVGLSVGDQITAAPHAPVNAVQGDLASWRSRRRQPSRCRSHREDPDAQGL